MESSAAGRATKTRTTFRLTYTVATTIDASPDAVWALLTHAADFARWNSTVTEIGGEIALGQRLRIRVPIAQDRVFEPRVTAFEPARRMEWSDGFMPMFKGVRTFTLTPDREGATRFSMTERFSGLMLPMIAGSLPDFREPFEQYAADLKREAERRKA
jgi:hypothetical protein